VRAVAGRRGARAEAIRRRGFSRAATVWCVSADPAPGFVLELPEPCLVVLVGAAGSGKSTLAERLFRPDAVLSSDAYRGLVSGDESNQAVTRVAFRLLHRDLHRRLAEGRTTVVDATNVTSFARRSLVRVAATHHVSAVAIVLDLDRELVLARNATRAGTIVPVPAVERQLLDLARSFRRGDFEKEGYASTWHLRAVAEVDAIAVPRGLAR
jgi:protein phosphatase